MTKKIANKSKSGRPTMYSPTIVNKLEVAFANAFNVDQACMYAGISKETFYNWMEKHPEFVDKMTKAKERPTMTAKRNVVQAIEEGNLETSKWWLERRAPEEFGKTNDGPPVTINFHQHVHQQRERYHI